MLASTLLVLPEHPVNTPSERGPGAFNTLINPVLWAKLRTLSSLLHLWIPKMQDPQIP